MVHNGKALIATLAKTIRDGGRRKSFVKEIIDSEDFGGDHKVAITKSTYDSGIVKKLYYAAVKLNQMQ
jgi:hypothetical protein